MTVATTGNGITLQTTASGILGKELTFSGTAPPQLAGDTIQIERSGHQTSWTWAGTVAATIAPDGTFSAVWQTNHIGRFAMRAVVTGASQAQSATVTPSLTTTVYRPSRATEYGPGFYGKKTACGQRLRRGTIGLADRTLKCGESVAIYFQGRTLVVPVIDRGPYTNGADWDLHRGHRQGARDLGHRADRRGLAAHALTRAGPGPLRAPRRARPPHRRPRRRTAPPRRPRSALRSCARPRRARPPRHWRPAVPFATLLA